jgi:nucleoside-diphosphate-sugar epimerase
MSPSHTIEANHQSSGANRTWMVTGGNGFLGQHVLEYLLREPWAARRIVIVSRGEIETRTGCDCVKMDLESKREVSTLIQVICPDVVLHMAGATPPGPAERFYRGNTLATANLVAGLSSLGKRVRLVATGSAAELGPVPVERLPVDERSPCRPVGDYAVSKWAASHLVLNAGPNVEGIVVRLFNLVGPGMPKSQAIGRFAHELATPGTDPVRLRVGDVDTRRDFVDVRDAARAVCQLGMKGEPGLYHVGTGQSRSIAGGLASLIRISGRAVVVEHTGEAASGPRDSRADITRVSQVIGWRPAIPFERSLTDLWKMSSGDTRLPLLETASSV